MSNLFSDQFFKDYKEEFINHFVEQSKERNDCILSEGTIRTLATNIYDALFFSVSIEKFKKLVRNALDSHVDFIVCLTKSSMLLIKDYIDYILKNSLSFENLKELVEYTEKFLVEAEEVYSVHIEKLRKEVNNLKKEKDKEVGEAFTRIFTLLKDKEVPIMLITFYKEVPVSCKALIDNVLESRIFVSFETCSYMKAFYDSSFIYLKITNAPKPIKAKKVDIFPEKKTIILEDFSFEEIPQERRKFVRVEPEEKFVVTVVKDKYSIKGIVADISIGGIGVFFKTKPELSLGDKVEVNFILKGTPLSIEGEVRYVIKQGEVYRVGIEFKLQPKQEEIIAEYVMQRQFEILKELKMM